MPSFPQIKLHGLYTYPNNLSEVPQGSLTIASNIVLDADGVIQSRRGIDTINEVLGGAANQLIPYQNQLIASYGNAGGLAWRETGVGWQSFSGTYFPPTSSPKIHSAESNSNLYFTTSAGIKKLDKYNGTVFAAGQPAGLDIEAALAGAGSGFFSNSPQLTTVGTTANGSPTITNIGSLAGIVGSSSLAPVYISGTGIPAGTTVSAITSGPVSFTATVTSVTEIVNVSGASASLLQVGQTITGTGIPTYTTIKYINGTTLGLSNAVTATNTGVTFTGAAISFSATTTNGSSSLTNVSNTTGLQVGQTVSGSGIPGATTIVSISGSTVVMSANATASASNITVTTATFTFTGDTNLSNSLTSASTTVGLVAGQTLSGNGIPSGTSITSIVGSTINLSANTTTSGSLVPITTTNSVNSIVISNNATATNVGTSLTFYSGSQVGYRILFGIQDANQNLILGAPSQLITLTNITSGSDNVTITATLPATITTANFYQVYRSAQTINSAISPSDELQLVFEGNPSSMDISNGYISFTDNTPDALRGATIYTASSEEGILQANYQPPLAQDIAVFKNCAIYANTTQLYQLNLTLLAVGSPSGVQIGDTLTIGGVTYTAGSSQNVGTNTFKVFTTGTAAQNIANTANSIVQVINRSTSNTTVYAYYLSSATDLPGKILFQARDLSSTGFSATASAHGSAYSPSLPTSGTSVSATQSIQQNALYISKTLQPEAVPLENVLFAGSAAYPIKRIVPLRDSLFILKDDGIFRMIGQDPTNFYIDLFDNTSKLLAPESVVNLNNTVYCLTNQGVISMSDTGLSVVSRPIEGDLLTLFGASADTLASLTWAVSYQSDRKYLLGIISKAEDVTPTQIYVYNVFTNAWTNWPLAKGCGIVNPADNKLYFGDALSGNVNIERKNFDYTDYVDGSFGCTVTAIDSTKTVLTLATVTGINVGDIFYQSSSANAVVESVDTVNVQITVGGVANWTIGAGTIFEAITCEVGFQPLTGNVPDQVKQYSELELFFKRARFFEATLAFTSDLSQATDELTIAGNNPATWGQFAWGLQPWGGTIPQRPIRTYIPLEKARCSQLNLTFTHRVGYGDFIFNGITLIGRPYSTRTTT